MGRIGQIAWNKGTKGIIKANKGSFKSGNKGHLGYKHSDKSKKQISEKKKQNPVRYWLGKKRIPFSKNTRLRMSLSSKGKPKSLEHRMKLSGANCHLWKGGISSDPYSIDWTGTLKKSIRERDKYTCQICETEPAIDVHHIDYNKKNCDLKNLITLCRKCHMKTNHNRTYWLNYFNQ